MTARKPWRLRPGNGTGPSHTSATKTRAPRSPTAPRVPRISSCSTRTASWSTGAGSTPPGGATTSGSPARTSTPRCTPSSPARPSPTTSGPASAATSNGNRATHRRGTADRPTDRDRGSVERMIGLPDHITASLFDLDGVLTSTAVQHLAAWRATFNDFLRERNGPGFAPFTDHDYAAHVDGRPRLDGVRTFLTSRGIDLPEGSPDDPPAANTMWGVGNRSEERRVGKECRSRWSP